MQIRRQLEVSGIVQGVGFRPHVYRLATERCLTGAVRNTSSGVTIEVQGTASAVDDFAVHLLLDAPPLARITAVVATDLPCNGDHEFLIIHSDARETVRTLVSPDVATCADCLREMFDSRDRRYRYPFINCTNCGPRFTIIHDIPYDRARTSMAAFKMCAVCQEEYDNPLNRRFHAQPNACWDCGPHLELWDNQGQTLAIGDPAAATITALKAGRIVAVKGLGGFHLAVDATNPTAVALLRERKRRVGKPFAIMVPDAATAWRICEISAAEELALGSFQRPIVLLRRRTDADAHAGKISEDVAPGNSYLGVFLPYTPLQHLLLGDGQFGALVMTSGNLSEEPIAIANDEALTRLSGIADCFLMHNRDILLRCDDSVVRVLPESPAASMRSPRTVRLGTNRSSKRDRAKGADKTQQLRRSRGFVPVPIFLRDEVPSILAVGGELKNTICLTRGKHAFLGQHVGDLENLESYNFFEEAIEHLQKVLEIRPEILACDLHPDYFSTKWARRQAGLPLVGVQHHHAHIASCMAENHLDGKVIGFVLDGTGYGIDGNIWGGEVLIAGYKDFERVAHFEYVPMPGGAAAIHEPWRMAVSYLVHHFGNDIVTTRLPFIEAVPRAKLDLLLRALERRINSPLTSSCGRLFDAVAAIARVRQKVSFEAQAAIELEMAAQFNLKDLATFAKSSKTAARASSKSREKSEDGAYQFDILPKEGRLIIGTRPMFEALIRDVHNLLPVREISRKFHEGLVNLLVQLAERLRGLTSLQRICLSGGTFNNLYLTTRLVSRLVVSGFEVFTQNEVPAGDGGLSLGQAMVAAHQASNITA
jgi:hydrogenase maturation protein HypF